MLILISVDAAFNAGEIIAKFYLPNLVQIPEEASFLGHLVDKFVLVFQGLNLILHLLLSILGLIYSSITLLYTPIRILLGLIRGEYVALLNSVRLVHALWITGILAKDTVSLDAMMTSSILLPTLTRV